MSVGWKEPVNLLLSRTVGYQLTRPPGHRERRLPPPSGDRMLVAPVFIFSSARSGSTLLRAILNAHSRLYGPPELPLMHLSVRAETRWIKVSLWALELTQNEVDNMLWDRVLADTLARSGKPVIVVKTPSNVLIWERIGDCWPDARFIFLLRHPAAVVASMRASFDPDWHAGKTGGVEESVRNAHLYMAKVEEARLALPGMTVRYEELTAKPEKVARGLCEFLGVPYEPGMLEYGQFADVRFAPGLGDASEKIRSGRIHPSAPPPRAQQLSPALTKMCASWGYLAADGEPDGSKVAGLADWESG
jgi:hypothetical protein